MGKNSHRFRTIHRVIGFIEQHTGLCLSAVLLLALIVRVAALMSLKNSLYYDYLLYDEIVYDNWARKIADGTYTSLFVYDFAPFPAYVFAFIYKLFSPNTLYIRILNIFLGTLTCFMIFLTAKELGGRITGLAASFIAALYKPFIFFSIVLQKTSISLFLFSAMTFLFLSLQGNIRTANGAEKGREYLKTGIKSFIFGAVLGILINTRSNCILIIPVIAVFIIWGDLKNKIPLTTTAKTILFYLAGLVIALSPFVIRNHTISGAFSITPAGGYNLYLSNNIQNPIPYYRPVPFATSVPSDQAVQFVIEASRRAGRKLSPGEASDFWTREVIKTAVEKPGVFTKKICIKLLAFFNKFESADNHHIGFISNFVTFFKLPFFSFWFILPFGIAGMMLNLFPSRKSFALFSIFIVYGVTLVVFFTNIRIRLPVLIILIPFAVTGISGLISCLKTRDMRRVGAYFAIAAVFFIIEFLPIPGTDDMTAYYNTHALNLDSRGRTAEAVAYWKKSSQMNKPYSAYADISLAAKYYKSGKSDDAFDYLDKISDDSFAASLKYSLLGDMLIQMGLKEKGMAAYEKSLQINYGQRNVHLKLFRLYLEYDNEKAQKQYDAYQYVASFYGGMS